MKEKKILILGANGMIGHKVYQVLTKYHNDVWAHQRTFINSNDKIFLQYNGKLRCPEILIIGDTFKCIRRRETIDDYLATVL